jgi:hypothetical protein
MGGVVWGIGAALREASEVDPHYGGFLNADIAEYLGTSVRSPTSAAPPTRSVTFAANNEG